MPMISFTPAADTLGHSAPLDQRATFPLLGVPLEIRRKSVCQELLPEDFFAGVSRCTHAEG